MKLFAPLINDVSTDLSDPPEIAAHSGGMSGRLIATIRKHYADLSSLHLDCGPDEAFRKVLEAAELMPNWKLSVIDRENRILQGAAITRLLRFRDDFVVRVSEGSGTNESVVDMRSRSRSGKGDFGANATRIRDFFRSLQGRN